jgi:S1-C subfamily serine protease
LGASPAPPAGCCPPADAARPEGDRREKSPAELFKDLAPAVVAVTTKGPLGRDGGGTGFLIDREGTIATNHHVIADSTAVRIKFMNGARFADVELLAEDAVTDLALLRVSLSKPADGASCADVVPVVLGDSGSVVVGERAVSIGNPLGLEHTLTDGLVSARRVFEGKQWIQISVPVSPGNSGGPLFNMRAEAIGVTTAQVAGGLFGRAQNLNLAVPVNVLKSMLRPSYPQRRKIGDAPSAGQW